ncbi:conserved hypothetical protein [Talaromyces stipitatus ATCC 10500]|uniref:Uncharacterized protein n=1 Tax=Talaromyces stipitatus (strain ATCC 10500 / CBS 375.48 / QM 6759 / NRRL 1006) TaxID=441959 RepID=B8MP43_TALSN|nr:uncharacterized protein TSTA_104960 [Talaromyces stipitatus ATCC 10500]EED14282.1 conserved hypothetical protein [Talaromyces stipitatus ATCC 10500]
MGIFGRSRANTTNEISQPVLTFSDAAPRDDLQSLRRVGSSRPRQGEKPTGASINARGMRQKPQKNGIHAFDFTVTQPPEGPLTVDETSGFNGNGIDSNTIGIALGSPSMVPPSQYRPPEWAGVSTPSEREDVVTTIVAAQGSLRRKPSKWKKLGGMLKGRQNNDGKQSVAAREGFYQLSMKNNQEDTSSPFVRQSQFPTYNTDDEKRPIVSMSPQFSDRWEDIQQPTPTDSLLAVNIPKVEMERYSVMFRSVLGEKPSSNLLTRRNQALNQLQVNGKEPGLHEPQKPQRRVTSPSTNRESTSTLFPGDPQNSAIANGLSKTTDTRGLAPRSPVRSNTFPRVAKNHHHENSLTVPDFTPALSTGTSSRFSYSSAEPSPIHFNGPITTARDYIDGKNEPAWEMITTRKSSSVSPEDITPGAEASGKSTLTPTMTTPLIAQDQVEVGLKAEPTTKPSITVLPQRKASLPAYADRAKLKVRNSSNSSNKISGNITPPANETNGHPPPTRAPPSPPRFQLQRSQTVPLPLNITKRSSTTNLLHTSTDSFDNDNAAGIISPSLFSQTPVSQAPSPFIPQTPQTIEISIARSVSVSKRIIPRQTLVPLGPANPQHFNFGANENERFGELRPKRVPVVIDVGPPPPAASGTKDSDTGSNTAEGQSEGGGGGSPGHRHQKSEHIVIESA